MGEPIHGCGSFLCADLVPHQFSELGWAIFPTPHGMVPCRLVHPSCMLSYTGGLGSYDLHFLGPFEAGGTDVVVLLNRDIGNRHG